MHCSPPGLQLQRIEATGDIIKLRADVWNYLLLDGGDQFPAESLERLSQQAAEFQWEIPPCPTIESLGRNACFAIELTAAPQEFDALTGLPSLADKKRDIRVGEVRRLDAFQHGLKG